MFLETTLKTTDGKYLGKSKTNVDCCLEYSIFKSEDGTNSRWPLVNDGSCGGGLKKNLQEWIDYSSFLNNEGLCYENWFYRFEGNFCKTIPKNCINFIVMRGLY
jgi:hypothetical protein